MHVCPLIVCVVYNSSPRDEANFIQNTCFVEHSSIQMPNYGHITFLLYIYEGWFF
jgi:hypothetical protein